MSTLHERNAAYRNRCCDWHEGDSSGRGDRSQPCRGERFPGRNELPAVIAERDELRREVEDLREQLRQAHADARFHGLVTR